MYQLTDQSDAVIRLTDKTVIVQGHRWWTEYQTWLSQGNVPKPAHSTVVTAHSRAIEVNRDYDTAVASLQDGWPDYEVITWTYQAAEARVYQAWLDAGGEGTPPAIPFLEQLNEHRATGGIVEPLTELVRKVLLNANYYTRIVSELTAKRHVAERALYGASTMEELMAITWDFTISD
jgi:hypothetical protein